MSTRISKLKIYLFFSLACVCLLSPRVLCRSAHYYYVIDNSDDTSAFSQTNGGLADTNVHTMQLLVQQLQKQLDSAHFQPMKREEPANSVGVISALDDLTTVDYSSSFPVGGEEGDPLKIKRGAQVTGDQAGNVGRRNYMQQLHNLRGG
ncbi:uncharacterized protein LOC134846166 [Symsagittifera roscoffensis]|uniref:uncharacterized protein LOC134846166 n=1 Tax=Symsagittifera roscoffensis TaxID=84072 RepID=UPI00307C7C0A